MVIFEKNNNYGFYGSYAANVNKSILNLNLNLNFPVIRDDIMPDAHVNHMS